MVAKARNVPQISEAALKLITLLEERERHNREAIDLIKVCNSPALALKERVSHVDQALLLLGYDEVLNLVLSLAIGTTLRGAMPGYVIEANGLWRHAYMAATAAENVVRLKPNLAVDAPAAFTAGLLHDIGKSVIAEAMTGKTQILIRQHMSGHVWGSIAAEREVLGTDHAEVGACLLHVWRLPDWIVEAVANHHEPVFEPEPQLSAVVHLANRIAHLAEADPGSQTYAFRSDEPVVRVFGINVKDYEELVEPVRRASDHAKELLKIL